jgi:hypothetical protein
MTAISTPSTSQPRRRPFVRFLLFSAGVIIALVILTVIGVSSLRSSRNQPIGVDAYPGAAVVSKSASGQNDKVVYETPATVRQVLDFYAQKFGYADQQNTDGCRITYLTDPGAEQPGKYNGRCVVSNSMLDVSQFLSIKIDYVAEADGKTGKTLISIDRTWGG